MSGLLGLSAILEAQHQQRVDVRFERQGKRFALVRDSGLRQLIFFRLLLGRKSEHCLSPQPNLPRVAEALQLGDQFCEPISTGLCCQPGSICRRQFGNGIRKDLDTVSIVSDPTAAKTKESASRCASSLGPRIPKSSQCQCSKLDMLLRRIPTQPVSNGTAARLLDYKSSRYLHRNSASLL